MRVAAFFFPENLVFQKKRCIFAPREVITY
nr:MAG TPA: hypothetical protein [Caudoviricetes sp.]